MNRNVLFLTVGYRFLLFWLIELIILKIAQIDQHLILLNLISVLQLPAIFAVDLRSLMNES